MSVGGSVGQSGESLGVCFVLRHGSHSVAQGGLALLDSGPPEPLEMRPPPLLLVSRD